MKIFLICSVRNATPEQIAKQEGYVASCEARGWNVHYPPRDTDQAARGIDICHQNMEAIREADEVHVCYDAASQGVHFDMGVAFSMQKRVYVVSSEIPGPGKSYARMLREWEADESRMEATA